MRYSGQNSEAFWQIDHPPFIHVTHKAAVNHMPRAYDRPFTHVFCINPCKQHSVSCNHFNHLLCLCYSAPANPAHDRLYDGKFQILLLFDQSFLLRIMQLVVLCVLVRISASVSQTSVSARTHCKAQ